MDLLIICLRTFFFYFFILIVYRVMGKREVGQLGIIDLIVSVLIAELVVISIEDYDISLLNSILPIFVLCFLQIVLSYISLKKPKFRSFLDGNPSIIIRNGLVNYQEMIKQKYNLDDLLVQLREKGYRDIDEIEYAVLENNGSLSIFPKDVKKTPYPMPLILDSKIQVATLNDLGKTKGWVIDCLERKKINLDDVFYAFYKDKNIFIIKHSELE